MSFEEGVSVADLAGINQMGLRPADVTSLLCETFNAQIFEGGFVHADPNPGNVLIRQKPGRPSEPQLVLLDHGLYRDLPRSFTLLYARLWQAILLGDADGIRHASAELGVGSYYPLLAAMLTGRPWADILSSAGQDGAAAGSNTERLQERGTGADRRAIRGYAQQYAKHIAIVLGRVPPEMLLLFKTTDCLRHAERTLQGHACGHSLVSTMRYCLEALLVEADGTDVVAWRPQLQGALPVRWVAQRARQGLQRMVVWLLRQCAKRPAFGGLLPRVVRLLSTHVSWREQQRHRAAPATTPLKLI